MIVHRRKLSVSKWLSPTLLCTLCALGGCKLGGNDDGGTGGTGGTAGTGGSGGTGGSSAAISDSRTLVMQIREVIGSFDTVEQPATAFGDKLDDAGTAVGDNAVAGFHGCFEVLSEAQSLENGETLATGCTGPNPGTVAVSKVDSGGTTTLKVAGTFCPASGNQALDLEASYLTDAETSMADSVAFSLAKCDVTDAKAASKLNGSVTFTDISPDNDSNGKATVEEFSGLAFTGNSEIAQAGVADPATVTGAVTASVSGCAAGASLEDCTTKAFGINGHLKDSNDDIGIVLNLSQSPTQNQLTLNLPVTFAGGGTGNALFTVTDTSPATPEVPTSLSLVINGVNGKTLTITQTAGFAGGELFVITISDGTRTLTLTEQNGPGSIFASLRVGGTTVGTIEDGPSGPVIRYTDGTIETLS